VEEEEIQRGSWTADNGQGGGERKNGKKMQGVLGKKKAGEGGRLKPAHSYEVQNRDGTSQEPFENWRKRKESSRV